MVGKSGDNESLLTVKDFVAGTVAGVLQVIVGQPFDIIKVRIQAQSQKNPMYKNPLDCARKIYTNEGFYTFYRGTLSPLVGIGACVSIQFGVNEGCKRMLKKYKKNNKSDDLNHLSLLELASCGAVAGLANSVVSIPVEHIRIKMQVEGTKLIKNIPVPMIVSRRYTKSMVFTEFTKEECPLYLERLFLTFSTLACTKGSCNGQRKNTETGIVSLCGK
jgi:hypothetical protein